MIQMFNYLADNKVIFIIFLAIVVVPIINMSLYVMVNCLKKRDSSKSKTNGWILIKERQPSYSGLYLVTVLEGGFYSEKTTALYYDGAKCIWYQSLETIDRTYNVTAWQPLPRPYREE